MGLISNHPTVKKLKESNRLLSNSKPKIKLDTDWLRTLCLNAGADDVGFVEIERKELSDQKRDILNLFPRTKSLISFVCKLNRENIRVPARSVANVEFHLINDHTNNVARKIVNLLEKEQVTAINPPTGFPMEMANWPEKMWAVSHKPIAVAAGLGKMGIHRSVIHPKYGSFVLLGTVLIEATLDIYNKPLDYNPCIECKLCAYACPTGAISSDGYFNFSNCLTHTYREFLGGFSDWIDNIVSSKNKRDYRRRFSDAETVSLWQSLAYGSNYKSVYCIAACPAGENVIGQFIDNRKKFVKDIIKPLQDKKESVYIVPGSDAEDYVTRRFPNKQIKKVGNGLRPSTIKGFLDALPLVFQRRQSENLETVYHFSFTGKEKQKATVIIKNRSVDVHYDHVSRSNIHIIADSNTWLKFLAKEKSILWALLFFKIRIKGSPRLLLNFKKCFPI